MAISSARDLRLKRSMKKIGYNLIMVFAGLALGWLSARYMMDNASVSEVENNKRWTEDRIVGSGLQRMYQSARYLWRGQLPPPGNVRIFRRTTDDEGNSLRTGCVVVIEGTIPEARWWYVGADSDNKLNAIAAGQAIREGSGQIAFTVSKAPMPGNWIIPEGNGTYTVQLVLHDATVETADAPMKLPSVKRLWC